MLFAELDLGSGIRDPLARNDSRETWFQLGVGEFHFQFRVLNYSKSSLDCSLDSICSYLLRVCDISKLDQSGPFQCQVPSQSTLCDVIPLETKVFKEFIKWLSLSCKLSCYHVSSVSGNPFPTMSAVEKPLPLACQVLWCLISLCRTFGTEWCSRSDWTNVLEQMRSWRKESPTSTTRAVKSGSTCG